MLSRKFGLDQVTMGVVLSMGVVVTWNTNYLRKLACY